MAKYTIELRKIIDIYTEDVVKSWFTDYNLTDYLTDEEIAVINSRGTWNKEKLANKIINHYFVREIGLETPELFKHYVRVRMNEIMEEYLPLIYSSAIKYDPLVNVDYTETFKRNEEEVNSINTTISSSITNDINTNNNSSGITVNSDTPQGQINKNDILNGRYASNTSAGDSTNNSNTISNNEETSNNVSNDNKSNTQDYIKQVKGNSGVSATAQKMIVQYRENIRAIDREIIEKLNDLFMGLY